jgi:hypothetical protein
MLPGRREVIERFALSVVGGIERGERGKVALYRSSLRYNARR